MPGDGMYTYHRRFHWIIISGRFLMRDERIAEGRPLKISNGDIQWKTNSPNCNHHAHFFTLPDRVGGKPESSDSELTTSA